MTIPLSPKHCLNLYPLLSQLREWRIVVRLMNDSIRYLGAQAVTPEQVDWIKLHKPELIVLLKEQAASPVVVVVDSPVDQWTPPTNSEDLWPSLAARLILEAPPAEQKALRETFARRVAWWASANIHPDDVHRMAFVDLEQITIERWGRTLAVWFSPEVKVEGIAVETRRPPAVVAAAPPTPPAEMQLNLH